MDSEVGTAGAHQWSRDSMQLLVGGRTCCSCWSQRSSPMTWRWKTTGAALKLKGSSSAAPAFMNGCRSELSCRSKKIPQSATTSSMKNPLDSGQVRVRPLVPSNQQQTIGTRSACVDAPLASCTCFVSPHLCTVNLLATFSVTFLNLKFVFL